MKRIYIILFIISLSFSSFAFINETSIKNISLEQKDNRGKSRVNKAALTENWTVSSYGFLVFPAASDLDEFLTLMTTKTHAQAQTYLASLSFASYGTSIYTSQGASDPVTAIQALDYLLDTSKMFQVYNIVIRPVSPVTCEVNREFILTVDADQFLDATSHANLRSGTYDQNSMNKFATNPSSDSTDLHTFIAQTPRGHEETVASDCPLPLDLRRPFWGWGPWVCTPCDQYGYQNCVRTYYVFWIATSPPQYAPHVPCND